MSKLCIERGQLPRKHCQSCYFIPHFNVPPLFHRKGGTPQATVFVFLIIPRHLPFNADYSLITGSSPHRMALVLKPPSLGDLMVFEDFPTQHQTKPIAEKKHDWPSRTEKRFKCVYEGCDRAYTKPSRLAEHEMTHRNEVRIVCA